MKRKIGSIQYKLLFFVVQLAFIFPESYASDFSYTKLKSTIDSQNIQTIEDLLPLLPEDFRSNPVLMYRSRGLQQADFQNPRAILFTRRQDDLFVMTFNGGGTFGGSNTVETLEFDKVANRFSFREIAFNKGVAPTFHPTNPPKCLACHQNPMRQDVDPRPNWEPYSFWPGAFGSDSDNVIFGLKKADLDMPDVGQILNADPALRYYKSEKNEEWRELSRLVDGPLRTHPRYKKLIFDVRGTSGFQPHYTNMHHQVLINENFDIETGKANAKRVVRLMQASKIYEKYKYAILGVFSCRRLFLPSNVLPFHTQHPFRPIYSNGSENPTLNDRDLEMIFEPFGIDTQDWSMDFRTHGILALGSRFERTQSLLSDFDSAFSQLDPTLFTHYENCKKLKQLSYWQLK